MDIKTIRYHLHWSQQDMAEALGCTRQHVSLMERGRKPAGTHVVIIKQLREKTEKIIRNTQINFPDEIPGPVNL